MGRITICKSRDLHSPGLSLEDEMELKTEL